MGRTVYVPTFISLMFSGFHVGKYTKNPLVAHLGREFKTTGVFQHPPSDSTGTTESKLTKVSQIEPMEPEDQMRLGFGRCKLADGIDLFLMFFVDKSSEASNCWDKLDVINFGFCKKTCCVYRQTFFVCPDLYSIFCITGLMA